MPVIPKLLFTFFGIILFFSSPILAKTKLIYEGENFYYTYEKSKKIFAAYKMNTEDQVASINLDDIHKTAVRFGNNSVKKVSEETKMRVAFFKNLLFDQDEKFYMAFNLKYNSSYLLYLLEFDKTSMIFKKRKIPSPRPAMRDLPLNASDYAKAGNCIFENLLFQVYVQEDVFIMEIKSLDEVDPKKYLKRYTFGKNEVIDFRNSPIMEETNIDRGYYPKFMRPKKESKEEAPKEIDKWLNILFWDPAPTREILNENEEKASTKFLRVSANKNIGILVKRVGEKSLELSIGNYDYREMVSAPNPAFDQPLIFAHDSFSKEKAMIFISYLSLPDFKHIDNDSLQEKGFE